MACKFCNSTQEPDENGICPACGRVVNQPGSDQQPAVSRTVDDEKDYPVRYWRCTWLILLKVIVIAAVIAGALAGGVWALFHYTDNETLNSWKKFIWICAMAIPSVYLLWGFISFIYKRLIKKYELHSKEIHLVQGFVHISTNITLLESLWGMSLYQNYFQKLFGTGKITLYSDDESSPKLHINDIGNIRDRFLKLISYQEHALDCSNVKVERNTNADTSVQYWRYSWCDLIDETLWGILITAISFFVLYDPMKNSPYHIFLLLAIPVVYWCCGLLWTFMRGVFFTTFTCTLGVVITAVYIVLAFLPYENLVSRIFLVLSVPLVYWCWLGWTYTDKIFFTLFTLNNATLIKESGIFTKTIDVYVLCHIRDCEMSQNLWQRLVGNVGNITFSVKWDNNESSDEEETEEKEKTDKNKGTKIILHGLKKHEELFNTFRERRLHERHRRQA